MNIGFGNNIIANEITIAHPDADHGEYVEVGANGKLQYVTDNILSTVSHLKGCTIDDDIALGITHLKNNCDDGPALTNYLNDTSNYLINMGIEAEAKKTVIIESNKGFIFCNSTIKIPSNISIQLKSDLVVGNDFTLVAQGSYNETPIGSITDAPYVSLGTTIGQNTININKNGHDISSWIIGDLLATRTIDDSTGLYKREDMVISTITDLGDSEYQIVFTKNLKLIDLVITDPVRRYEQYTVGSNLNRGDSQITLNETITNSILGSYLVFYYTDKLGDDLGNPLTDSNGDAQWYSNNLYKLETRQVSERSGNLVRLNDKLSNDYDYTKLKIVRLTPNEGQIIESIGGTIIQVEEPDINVSENKHFILMNRCVGSTVKGFTFKDDYELFKQKGIDVYPSKDNYIRLRESYMSDVKDITISRYNTKYSNSAQSYGITSYYNSYCNFTNIKCDTLRHNMLLQGSDNCMFSNIQFLNPLISALDCHGLNARDNVFDNIYIKAGQGINSSEGNSTIAAIRVGNSFHGFGDHYNIFKNIVIKGCRDASPISSIYGIELVPQSSNNLFQNIIIEDCQYGIAIFEHPRNRLVSTCEDNTFDDVTIKNCKYTVDIDCNKRKSSSHNIESGVLSSPTTNTIVIVTGTNTDFDDYYNGWQLEIGGVYYTVTDYVASTKTITISGTFSPTLSGGENYTLNNWVSSTVTSNKLIKNIKFLDCKFYDNDNFVDLYYADGIEFYKCLFNNNSSVGNSCVDVRYVDNFKFCNNTMVDVQNGLYIKYTDNAVITDNTFNNIVDRTIIHTANTNTTLVYTNNIANNFEEIYDWGGSPTFSKVGNTAQRMYTIERDDLNNILHGSIIYNMSTNKLQVWTGAAWIDLH